MPWISCRPIFHLPIINMTRMKKCGLVGIKFLLQKWWIFLVKLLKKKSSSFNLLLYSNFWNLVNHWQILRAWNNFFIFWRWKTLHANIGLTLLDGIQLKTCITLSLSLLKLLVKRLATLILVVMRLAQFIINFGVMCMFMLLMALKWCHCHWILRG